MRNGSDAQDTLSFESCSSSNGVWHGRSPRGRMQDKEETTSEPPWTAVTEGKGKRCGGWNRRVKREKPEVTVLRNEADGVSVNSEGESHHEQTRATITRRVREDQAKMEREADRNGPDEEGEEIQSPK